MFQEDDHPNATPVITLELLSRSDSVDNTAAKGDESDGVRPTLILDSTSGVHFLTDDQANSLFATKVDSSHEDTDEIEDVTLSPAKSKQELLEYLIRSDGSVVCKLCGEILQSRTHWYRHKYKFHVAPAASPSPIFKCEQCCVFFKSRKGYIGHLASRHPDNETSIIDMSPSNQPVIDQTVIKQEPVDAELAIPSCELPNVNFAGVSSPSGTNSILNNKSDYKKIAKLTKGNETYEIGSTEWEKQRLREERLVADIIARVRRECEAAGASGGARRGYTRRSALTNG